jgi:hypothetical protein
VHNIWVASGRSNIFDWENVHAVATAQLLAMPEICTPLQRRTYTGGWCGDLLYSHMSDRFW